MNNSGCFRLHWVARFLYAFISLQITLPCRKALAQNASLTHEKRDGKLAENTSSNAVSMDREPSALGNAEHGDTQSVLDDYEEVKNFYAYDPVVEKWIPIRNFYVIQAVLQNQSVDIDWTIYANFWAYNDKNEWFKVSLIKFLQQSLHSHDVPFKSAKAHVVDKYMQEYDQKGFLEELINVKSISSNKKSKLSRYLGCSFQVSMGLGAFMFLNRLKNMLFSYTNPGDYYVVGITRSDNDLPIYDYYRSHWFTKRLEHVSGSSMGLSPNSEVKTGFGRFRGFGIAMPLTLAVNCHIKRAFLGFGKDVVFNRVNASCQYVNQGKGAKTLNMRDLWCFQNKWFLQFGLYIWQFEHSALKTDLRLLWIYHMGQQWKNLLVSKNYLYKTFTYDFGLCYERPFMDYLSWTARLAFEWQRFLEFQTGTSTNIIYKWPTVFLQMGLIVRI